MSDDLISRKAVLEILYDISNRNYGSFFGQAINKACDVIKHADTAFDKEKVIEELKDARDIPHDDSMAETISTRIWNKAITKSIKIVEKGGIE